MAKRQTVGKKRKAGSTKKKSSNLNTYLIVGAGVLGVILIGALLASYLRGEDETIDGVVNFGRMARTHVDTEIVAGDLPPAGGEHNPAWLNCGIYDKPVAIGSAVHSLEHGAVWIAYQPGLSADEVETLRQMVRGQTYLILAPYSELRSPVVATAWSVQLELDSATDGRLADFIARYRQGPTTPERGASCTGGVGEPVS